MRTHDPYILVALVRNPPASYSHWHKKIRAAFIPVESRRRCHLDDCHLSPLVKEAEGVVNFSRVSFSDEAANVAGDTSFGTATIHLFSTVKTLRLGTVPTNGTELNLYQREKATVESFQLSAKWLQDISSDGIQAKTNTNIDWLTTKFSKPHLVPLSLENEGAANSNIVANEGAADPTAQVEVSLSEDTVNSARSAEVNNADKSERNADVLDADIPNISLDEIIPKETEIIIINKREKKSLDQTTQKENDWLIEEPRLSPLSLQNEGTAQSTAVNEGAVDTVNKGAVDTARHCADRKSNSADAPIDIEALTSQEFWDCLQTYLHEQTIRGIVQCISLTLTDGQLVLRPGWCSWSNVRVDGTTI